jgi:hypothetical protein
MSVCAAVVVRTAFNRTQGDAANALVNILHHAEGLQMLTVLVIGISAFLLRLLDQISADAAVSALTGIAGFVLGGFTRRQVSIR